MIETAIEELVDAEVLDWTELSVEALEEAEAEVETT